MYCRYCGEEIPSNAKFCGNCGNVAEETAQEKKAGGLKIDSNLGSSLCILLSILSFLSFFLPWIRVDGRVSWFTGESFNYFRIIQFLRETGEDEAMVSIAMWLLIITAALLLLIHLSGVRAAVKRNNNFALYCSDSGAWSIVFSVIFVVTVFVLDGQQGVFHYGWGMLVVLLLSAAQIAVCRYIHMCQVDVETSDD